MDNTAPFDYATATEAQLRDAPKVWPKTLQELQAITEVLINRQHDYGSSAMATAILGEAAMNYAASQLGLTGFQFSSAEMVLLGRSRHLTLGGILLDYKDALYPQYDILGKVRASLEEARPAIQTEAARLVEEANEEAGKPDAAPMSARVFQHWQAVARGETPYIK